MNGLNCILINFVLSFSVWAAILLPFSRRSGLICLAAAALCLALSGISLGAEAWRSRKRSNPMPLCALALLLACAVLLSSCAVIHGSLPGGASYTRVSLLQSTAIGTVAVATNGTFSMTTYGAEVDSGAISNIVNSAVAAAIDAILGKGIPK